MYKHQTSEGLHVLAPPGYAEARKRTSIMGHLTPERMAEMEKRKAEMDDNISKHKKESGVFATDQESKERNERFKRKHELIHGTTDTVDSPCDSLTDGEVEARKKLFQTERAAKRQAREEKKAMQEINLGKRVAAGRGSNADKVLLDEGLEGESNDAYDAYDMRDEDRDGADEAELVEA
jgi:hypothetical protein